ncbi:GL13212 [Drosophila persimilis]|uniref:Cytosol aminopeptidase n=1 Tax=Drosophila persimilis TaxID=7234 RepID=B4IR10_DROPE|nr:GL13212 [Drosophila persimilis]
MLAAPATTSSGYPASLDLYARKDEICDLEGWRIGLQKAAAQNLTRQLQEMPSNLPTPTAFAQNVVEVLCKSGFNVEVKVEGWAESQSMHAFLAVGKASCELPIFLELSYYGTCAEERPIVLVGQGVTYDAGGLCLKEKHELFHMRGDMTGAAVVVACCRAVAGLRLPVNIRGLIPLCENVVGCNSVRTGDMVESMNGKTIEIQCTDHEDVLVLADALLYAQNFCPKCIIDVGTCSGYMRQALDESAAGVFTNSEILWQQIKHASMHTGDRVWRFPLWKYYSKAVRAGGRSDVQNYGIDRGGRPCKAAAFLREFVPCGQWMHILSIDATNVMVTKGFEYEYLRKGMAGRPTRTLVEFIALTIFKDTAPRLAK